MIPQAPAASIQDGYGAKQAAIAQRDRWLTRSWNQRSILILPYLRTGGGPLRTLRPLPLRNTPLPRLINILGRTDHKSASYRS